MLLTFSAYLHYSSKRNQEIYIFIERNLLHHCRLPVPKRMPDRYEHTHRQTHTNTNIHSMNDEKVIKESKQAITSKGGEVTRQIAKKPKRRNQHGW